MHVIGSCVLFVFVCSLHYGSCQVNTFEELIQWVDEGNEDDAFDDDLLASLQSNSTTPNDIDTVKSWLYTRDSPDVGHRLVPDDPDTLWSSDFGEYDPTKIIIHGWLGNSEGNDSVCMELKSQYFKSADSYNVICVDWSLFAIDLSYFFARLRCKSVAYYVAELISMLTNYSSQTFDDIHMIGFSMGAHIAGYAGKQFEGQLHRISGLDPASPLFPLRWPNERLHENDAKLVDIVHTTSWVLGQHNPIGKIDFYPNGGNTKQPGCSQNYVSAEVCSHFKAYEFYARSILFKDEFKSIKCDQYEDFKQSRCNEDDDDFTYLGEYVNSSSSGNYYLSTE